VSFFMNKFRKLGFIEYNGKLEIHNSLLNVVLHDKPEIKTRDDEAPVGIDEFRHRAQCQVLSIGLKL
jgi:hypothetical protein